MNWQTVKINNITEVVTKGTTPTTYGMPFTDDGINFIKAEALNGDSALDHNGFTFVSEETHTKLARSILKKDDVLVTIAGANVGRCGYVREWDLPANTNQAVGIVRVNPSKAEPRFVYYYFKHPLMRAKCLNIGGQAAQPNVNLGNLKSFDVPLPDRLTQKRIASILSAYDDLIENNRRRIALLEEAARLLYREWFVYFRFPGHEHVKIVDGVPEGWRKKTVGDLTEFLSRGITPTYDEEAQGLVINQKCIRDSKVSLEQARYQSKRVPNTKHVRKYDVLINSTGAGTLGRVAQNHHDLAELTVDSHVTIARAKEGIPPHWYGLSLTLKQDYIATLGRGATNQTELSKDDIAAIKIAFPKNDILIVFETQAASMIRQINLLSAQSIELAKARNL